MAREVRTTGTTLGDSGEAIGPLRTFGFTGVLRLRADGSYHGYHAGKDDNPEAVVAAINALPQPALL